jgi:hypothetical protein
MLADLALTGETRGSLLFAFLRADESDDAAITDGAGVLVQRLRPSVDAAQSLDPTIRVDVAALCPDRPSAEIHFALDKVSEGRGQRYSWPLPTDKQTP